MSTKPRKGGGGSQTSQEAFAQLKEEIDQFVLTSQVKPPSLLQHWFSLRTADFAASAGEEEEAIGSEENSDQEPISRLASAFNYTRKLTGSRSGFTNFFTGRTKKLLAQSLSSPHIRHQQRLLTFSKSSNVKPAVAQDDIEVNYPVSTTTAAAASAAAAPVDMSEAASKSNRHTKSYRYRSGSSIAGSAPSAHSSSSSSSSSSPSSKLRQTTMKKNKKNQKKGKREKEEEEEEEEEEDKETGGPKGKGQFVRLREGGSLREWANTLPSADTEGGGEGEHALLIQADLQEYNVEVGGGISADALPSSPKKAEDSNKRRTVNFGGGDDEDGDEGKNTKETAPVEPPVFLEHAESDVPCYRCFFHNQPHINLMGTHPQLGPMIISVLTKQSSPLSRMLLWTCEGEVTAWIPACNKAAEVTHMLKRTYSQLSTMKFYKMGSSKSSQAKDGAGGDVEADLLHYETRLHSTNYKFGVLYCGPGQTDENDMYANEQGSAEFDAFLEFLGEKIALTGWQGFRGGLDVKGGTTGTHSVYTKYFDFEIMFHVSTMLPFQAEDEQHVERKRHIGNDVVVIVFKDNNLPFKPEILTSQCTQIMAVVEPIPHPEATGQPGKYRIGFISKKGVAYFGPPVPQASDEFEATPHTWDFLMTKLINGEKAAMRSPAYALKFQKTKRALLKHILDKHSRG